nr:MAG TPA: hypothetical protein [Crassvirales sp.]
MISIIPTTFVVATTKPTKVAILTIVFGYFLSFVFV